MSSEPTAMRVRMMRTRPAMMILASKTPTCLPPDSWMDLAASPIMVCRPVSVTSASHSPTLTIEPDQSFLPEPGSPSESSRGTATGSDSPVRAAWSTASSSPSTHLASAGTTLPPRRKTMSPGTISTTLSGVNLPSRLTGSLRTMPSLRAEMEACALTSSMKPRVALVMRSAKMIQKSTHEPSTAERRPAISIMAGIVPTNCIANIFQRGSFSSGISLRPQTFMACSAWAEVRPSGDVETSTLSVSDA
mmetsp:Transcript_23918/g.61085  ORF Transcript_23918/g.61085 Transcript_23918/m.61085 type:complete len:248 (+) Transcript_23918:2148-2891(+)